MSTPGRDLEARVLAVAGPRRAERDDGKGDQGRDDRDQRRQQVERLVDVGRHDAFLQEHLGPVGQRLKQAEGNAELAAGPIRADAILRIGGDLALDVDQVGDRAHEHAGHHDDLERNTDQQKHRLKPCLTLDLTR